MNEKLQQHLDVIVSKLIQAADVTVDFGSEQLPILVKEILVFQGVNYILTFLTWVILGYLLFKKVWPFIVSGWKKYSEGDPEIVLVVFSAIAATITTPITIAFGFNNLILACKVWLAPRLYLLEYVAQLVKPAAKVCGGE